MTKTWRLRALKASLATTRTALDAADRVGLRARRAVQSDAVELSPRPGVHGASARRPMDLAL